MANVTKVELPFTREEYLAGLERSNKRADDWMEDYERRTAGPNYKSWRELMSKKDKNTMEMPSGETLKLKQVGYTAILQFFDGMGGIERFIGETSIGEVINSLDDAEKVKAVKSVNGLINYVAGWGVENTPSNDDLKVLGMIGQYTGIAKIDKAMWVRFILLDGNDELAMQMVTRVMELSRGD